VTLPVLIVGAGARATLYSELIRHVLADRLRLVGVVGRSELRARALAEACDVPFALEGDLEDAAFTWSAAGAIVCPSSDANARMARRVAAQGLPLLLETPPSLAVAEAEDLLRFISAQGVAAEVAEQNTRAPEAAFLQTLIRAGLFGDVRLVACDLASYRYHATGVGRALLGKPRGRRAVGLRTRFPDLPEHAATVTVGTIEADGALLQVRDGEGLYLPDGPWRSGGWSVYGSRGSWVHGQLRIDGADVPIEHTTAMVNGVDFTGRLGAHGVVWEAAHRGSALNDDRRAIACCLTDWLARVNGDRTPSQWSLEDGVEDLRWIDGLERSALLGGAPIAL
jgi:predicted dehydrogenase